MSTESMKAGHLFCRCNYKDICRNSYHKQLETVQNVQHKALHQQEARRGDFQLQLRCPRRRNAERQPHLGVPRGGVRPQHVAVLWARLQKRKLIRFKHCSALQDVVVYLLDTLAAIMDFVVCPHRDWRRHNA